ncbi:DUF4124 domain-containing protein [Gilvimarinus sp. DA14]|uniref:DUF4124 domain-containing protein n=1 Tax=Gilvimarinus sp. DA14 TaxID=2956798 RepID=UPI0020B6CA22|nr:DUF4124 domain-containing protein [Gilvimarinus sp. DA14]UTF58818.1 DUF4124 domain-containing protein [Gilvimarinus sp. DA14]
MNKFWFLALCITLPVQAELYRWTDADGQVHYSDRKPDATKAEGAEVTEQQVKPINIQDSGQATAAMRQVFPEQHPQPSRTDSKRKSEMAKRKEEHCREAREYLRKISGRVQFIDEDGNMVHVSERERQERQAQMEAYVKEQCF